MRASRSQAPAWLYLLLTAAASCKPAPEPPPAQPATPELESCSAWADFVCKHVADHDPLCPSVRESLQLLTPAACARAFEQREHTAAQLDKRSQLCGALADKACADLPGETRYCKMVRERVAHSTPDFCVDMLHKYPETLAQMKQQLAADRLLPDKAAGLYAGDPPAFGPKDAPIQMVEFVDYESMFSAQTAVIVRNLATKYASQLHFVMRQFPLEGNAHAHLAAQAALAAHAQGKYWPMHDKLIENRTQLDRAALLRYAQEIGLDTAQFKAALDQKTYAVRVDADFALAKSLQVVGMPTVYINNERLLNSVDEAGMIAAIEEYLALGSKPAVNGI